jgi:hypothetical protein
MAWLDRKVSEYEKPTNVFVSLSSHGTSINGNLHIALPTWITEDQYKDVTNEELKEFWESIKTKTDPNKIAETILENLKENDPLLILKEMTEDDYKKTKESLAEKFSLLMLEHLKEDNQPIIQEEVTGKELKPVKKLKEVLEKV